LGQRGGGVEIDGEDPGTALGERGGEVAGGDGLTYPALVVGDRNDVRGGTPSPIVAVSSWRDPKCVVPPTLGEASMPQGVFLLSAARGLSMQSMLQQAVRVTPLFAAAMLQTAPVAVEVDALLSPALLFVLAMPPAASAPPRVPGALMAFTAFVA